MPAYPIGQPVVAPKNPAVSLIVSFFLPGVGSMINGDVGTGVIILIIWLISFPLMFVFIGFLTVVVAFVWGLVDAYQGARRWNARHGIIS
jgi:TM2 domain-containing membrane protein YozV